MERLGSLLYTHALVAHFLETQGYTDTLETFRQEAEYFLTQVEEDNDVPKNPSKPLISVVDDSLNAGLDDKMKKLAEDRDKDEVLNEQGDGRFPTVLANSYDTIHSGNILTAQIHHVPQEDGTDQATIVSGSTDRSIKLTDYNNEQTINLLTHHNAAILSTDFHPLHPKLLLSGGMDQTVQLVDIETNDVLQSFKNHTRYVVKVKFSPNGQYFASCSYDKTFNLYKTTKSDENGYPVFELLKTFYFRGYVEAMTYTPDSSYVVVGVREDNYLYYINLENLEYEKHNMNSNGDDWVSFTPMDLSVSPDGRYLLCSTDDRSGRAILFRVRSSVQPRNFYGIPHDEFSNPRHAWHPSGKYFFATGDDRKIRCIEVKSGKVLAVLAGHTEVIRSLSYDKKLDVLISAGFDKTVKVWKCEDAAN
ncbi:WD40 repeat-like protein [Basidiobolus meristosporus CBS 931.73]|uniref:WD40 repeat-like protein n=1 Tax=Basidiobolus meristosporus CBS 931.73 TaxID=1314790 RepID=A0A1Y1Y2N2_9FUNG|nr:WD40 repeat-like protein [Basidiobolus meristosporus CBS 931.73]|eukprot:ORX91966.1 WD40 repeat-like protein [Basidiobolus meristosporus CBS 931.73]